ncbi:MAG: hypothetical protein REI78_13220 [Pedobacter sp.]|nr:hypothetical protein [Pedobacter sp.]MDQ8053988.1 hypothetical protein [Pedobacter sp.]
MNFLSHFYFEKDNPDPYQVMGTVLPDLIKNAAKDWNFYPQKKEALFEDDPFLNSLLIGWKKHLEVDRFFHSSTFFLEETAQLKKLVVPILEDSPVRPSFLAHIGLELMLDHLLVEQNLINITSFYDQLARVNDQILHTFLQKAGAEDSAHFFRFLESFKSSRYLLSYQKIENISYALQRICMRLWTHPFSEDSIGQLTHQLSSYKLTLEKNYLNIFREMALNLKSN